MSPSFRTALVTPLFSVAACGATGTEDPPVAPPKPAPRLEAPTGQPRLDPDGTEEDLVLAAGGAELETRAGEDADEPRELEGVVGSVAGVPLLAEDLLLEWHMVAGRDVWLVIDKLVATRLAIAEAQRLGLRLAPEAVEERVADERAELSASVAALGIGLEVEDYIRSELGMEPDLYHDRIRRATIRQLLVERAVRAWTLANDNVSLRLIVVPEEETMDTIEAALAEGGDFAALAEAHSVDDTAPAGGFVPYLIRQEHSPLARLAFTTEPGEIGGPLPSAEHQFLIRVEERRSPIEGRWSEVGDRVEASLKEHPVSDSEFLHWNIAMKGRYPIDLTALKELLESES